MNSIETDRLVLRPLSAGDARFMLGLLNEPSFLTNIGDRGVRTSEQAERYIDAGPGESYRTRGYGLLRVELKGAGTPVGICGLVKRDFLDLPDLGFAFLPDFWRRGFGFESSSAILADAKRRLSLPRILGLVAAENEPSIRLLEKMGFRYERKHTTSDGLEHLIYGLNLK